MRDEDLVSSAKRLAAFWLTVIVAVVVVIVLCMALSAVFGTGTALHPTLGQGYAYHGGFHDHRL